MARTDVPVTRITRAGAWPAAVTGDTVNNHVVANDGAVFLHVTNTDVSPHNITFITPVTVLGLAVADLVVAVPASSELAIGPFPTATFNQISGVDIGKMQVDVDNVNLDLRALRL